MSHVDLRSLLPISNTKLDLKQRVESVDYKSERLPSSLMQKIDSSMNQFGHSSLLRFWTHTFLLC